MRQANWRFLKLLVRVQKSSFSFLKLPTAQPQRCHISFQLFTVSEELHCQNWARSEFSPHCNKGGNSSLRSHQSRSGHWGWTWPAFKKSSRFGDFLFPLCVCCSQPQLFATNVIIREALNHRQSLSDCVAVVWWRNSCWQSEQELL